MCRHNITISLDFMMNLMLFEIHPHAPAPGVMQLDENHMLPFFFIYKKNNTFYSPWSYREKVANVIEVTTIQKLED